MDLGRPTALQRRPRGAGNVLVGQNPLRGLDAELNRGRKRERERDGVVLDRLETPDTALAESGVLFTRDRERPDDLLKSAHSRQPEKLLEREGLVKMRLYRHVENEDLADPGL